MQFRRTPTHHGSPAEARKDQSPNQSLASLLRELNPCSRSVGRGGRIRCKDKNCGEHRCGPLSCLDYQHTRAPFDAVDKDSSCKIWTNRVIGGDAETAVLRCYTCFEVGCDGD